ncbi:hypothetical protein LTR08_006080 [Meristemomyces frigidus]|nr:hypothetical protein LTR08_006080 [Meristemomyces frigidus]
MVFYEPGKTPHGLPRDPFKVSPPSIHLTPAPPSTTHPLTNPPPQKACVTPRPIGWISTRSLTGIDNLAPYSQFNNLSFDPPYVMFAANQDLHRQRKDSTVNAEATGEFCWNVATWELRELVNATAEWFAPGVDEFARCGVEKESARVLRGCSMVKRSPVKFECRYYSTVRLPGNAPMGAVDVVIGRVVAVHIDEGVLTEGVVDLGKVQPIARCGYHQYVRIMGEAVFEMVIPGDERQGVGLEGDAEMAKALGGGGGGGWNLRSEDGGLGGGCAARA